MLTDKIIKIIVNDKVTIVRWFRTGLKLLELCQTDRAWACGEYWFGEEQETA